MARAEKGAWPKVFLDYGERPKSICKLPESDGLYFDSQGNGPTTVSADASGRDCPQSGHFGRHWTALDIDQSN
jgi:hypothetical protein